MKFIKIFSLLFLFPLISLADDWDLFQPYQETYYTITSGFDTLISRYEVDSVYVSNDTSYYLLNYNYLKDFQNTENFFLYNIQPDIDLSDILNLHYFVKHANHEIFIRDTYEIYFNGKAQIGETVNSNNGISISCIDSGVAEFLNITDSVKIFEVSKDNNFWPLILSKSYGLLKGPHLSDLLYNNEAQILSIAGIDDGGMFRGNKTPRVESFIPYQVGDTILIRDYYQFSIFGNGSYEDPSINYKEYVFQSRFDYTDSIEISYTINGIPYSHTCNKKILQKQLDYNIHNLSNGFSFGIIGLFEFYSSYLYSSRLYYDYSKNKYNLKYKSIFNEDDYDFESLSLTYKTGIGLKDYNFNHWSGGGSMLVYKSLYLVSNPSTYELIYDDPPQFIEIEFVLNGNYTLNLEVQDSIFHCQNDTVQLTESGNSAINWIWTGPNNFFMAEQNPIFEYSGSIDSGWYYVTITNAIGETAIDSTYLGRINVINEYDSWVFVCENTSIEFSGNANAQTWNWDGPDSFYSNSQTISFTNVNESHDGIYTLEVEFEDGHWCYNTFDLIVRDSPEIDMVESYFACEEQYISIDGSSSGVSTWFTIDDTISMGNASLSVPGGWEAGEYLVFLYAENGYGCFDFDSVLITINENPTIDVPEQIITCQGATVEFNEIGNDAITWNWELPDGSIINQQSFQIENVQLSDAGIYSIQIVDVNGCENNSNIELLVYDHPQPYIETTNQITICLGATLNLTETGNDAISWNWQNPDGLIISDQQTFQIENIQTSDAGNYSLQIMDANGCINSELIELIIKELPTIELEEQIFACEGELVTISAEGTDIQSWEWSGPNGFYSNEQINEMNIATSFNSGVYVVSANANGCSAHDSTQLIVNVAPQLSIQNAENTVVVLGESIELTLDIIDNATINSIEWQPNQNISANDIANPTVSPTESTLYTVTVENEFGCISTDQVFVQVEIETAIEALENDIFVYPNPTKNQINLKGLDNTNFEISIFNNIGELLFTRKNETEIDLKEYPEGVYFYSIKQQLKIINGSIVKL